MRVDFAARCDWSNGDLFFGHAGFEPSGLNEQAQTAFFSLIKLQWVVEVRHELL